MNKEFNFFKDSLIERLVPPNYLLLPNVNDIFELEFALGELTSLSETELIERSAFWWKINGLETYQYKIGSASNLDAYNSKSIRTRSFFSKGRFSTGYGLHNLFPYRGKFHPQLVKGIINIIGMKPGDVMLDPMMGSGTACIEAQTMGINVEGIDISPFCYLISYAKSIALTDDLNSVSLASNHIDQTYSFISNYSDKNNIFETFTNGRLIVLLAYLDAMGYARRVKDKSVNDKFPEVIHRYTSTIKEFSALRKALDMKIGVGNYQIGDAKNLHLIENSIDGIITSPPYSFAIDYIENDLPQLEFLGVDQQLLRENLIGLRGGKKKTDRIELYLNDMETIFKEMTRVLKPNKYCVVVIGSNEIQTGGILFDKEFVKIAKEVGLHLAKSMLKPIRGIQNSMTDEYVLFFRK